MSTGQLEQSDVEWEAEIRIRRNGRCVRIERALGRSPGDAIYAVTNDLEREYLTSHDRP